MAKFAIYSGETLEREIEVTEHGALIGRADQNDVILTDPSKSVSRFHAELKYEEGKLTVVDLNSQNGTWVTGKRVHRAVLNPGDEIAMGNFRLVWLPGATVADDFGVDTEAATMEAPARSVNPFPVPDAAPRPSQSGAAAPTRSTASAPGRSIGTVSDRAPGGTVPPNAKIASGQPASPTKPAARASSGRKATNLVVVALVTLVVVAAAGYAAFFTAAGHSLLGSTPAPGGKKPAETAGTPGQAPPRAGGLPATQAAESSQPASPPVAEPIKSEEPIAAPAVAEKPTETAEATTEPARGQLTPAEAKRSKLLQDRYTRAKAALSKGDYATAVAGFEALVAEQPKYQDAAKLLQAARAGAQEAARREQELAKREYDAGVQAEAGGNHAAAVQHLEQALKADPSNADAQDALRRVRERMRAEGEDAYKRAKQYDALGRTADAIGMYEKAVQLLPADHLLRASAKERLEVLRAIK